jgi:hypothetical protein
MVSDFEIKIHYHMQISAKAGGTGKQHGLIFNLLEDARKSFCI